MPIFASHFWLWSIIGLIGFFALYTFGSLMHLAGFLSPVRALGRRVDALGSRSRLVALVVFIGLLAYPSVMHRLWADATAGEIRRQFQSIPHIPDAVSADATEQWAGLYDPTGTDGAYMLGWFGTAATAQEVLDHYRGTLLARGWNELVGATDRRGVRFLDRATPAQSHYELVLVMAPAGSSESPMSLAGHKTVYAVRLGAVDPRVTTQIAWLIDCLVRAAPTFPTCEPKGWHPLEQSGSLPSGRGPLSR